MAIKGERIILASEFETRLRNIQNQMNAIAAGGGGGEPALGNPGADGDMLVSTMAGVRSWAVPGGGGYTLPVAEAAVLGGVKIGSRLTIAAGVLSADVQTTDISGKVDKVAGSSLVVDTEIAKIHVSGSDNQNAAGVAIADAGGLITATEVEGALQENRTAINLNTAKVTNANHSGDVTGATALTIAAKAVSYAKIQDLAANKVLGSVAGGAVEEIACTAAGRSLLAAATVVAAQNVLGATTQTVNFDNSMTAAQIQALIDAVPRYIPPGVIVTFQFADGEYTLNATLSFIGFFGGGSLYIYGNTGEANATILHTSQSVFLNFSASSCYGLSFKYIQCFVYFRNLKIKTKSHTTAYFSVFIQYCLSFIDIRYNYLLGENATVGNTGACLAVLASSSVYSYRNTMSYHTSGHYVSQMSMIESNSTASVVGELPQYGLVASASTIIKVGTQTTGSVGNESSSDGGVIRGAILAHQANVKIDYAAGNLDTEAELITAINATNTKINAILAAIENVGVIANV